MIPSIVRPSCAVVVGASGGLGRAFVAHLVREAGFAPVHALSRSGGDVGAGTQAGIVEITDEASIKAAAAEIAAAGVPVGVTIVATGLLHGRELRPEKTWRELDPDQLAESFRVNAVGPALVAKHLLPLMPRRGKAVFAALSARVGSIGDNRLGGWYGYRASKAALNQLIRTLAIELARGRPDAICIGLHPGTVDTELSRPFQAGVPAGRLFTSAEAAERLLHLIEAATPRDSGAVLAWDGAVVPP